MSKTGTPRDRRIMGLANRLRREERGLAMASVVILGAILVAISVVLVVTTASENRVVSGDRTFEQAVHVAESGIDTTLTALDPIFDDVPTTFDDVDDVIESLDLSDAVNMVSMPSSPTKQDVLDAAESLASAEPDTVLETPEGEVVVVGPEEGLVLYGVGFTPALDAGVRKERVVVVDYWPLVGTEAWDPGVAILSDGPLTITGGSFITGGAHTNGKMDVQGGAAIVDECVTGYDPESTEGPDCPVEVEYQFIPSINPLSAHHRSEYDVCRFGASFSPPASGVYAGPANTAVAEEMRAEPGKPCSGAFMHPNLGIFGVGSTTVEFERSRVPPGVFYVDGADVIVRPKRPRDGITQWSILAGTVDAAMDCSTSGGTIHVMSQGDLEAPPGANKYVFVAGGDLNIESQIGVKGLLATHEQVRYSSGINVFGNVVVESACDSASSPLRESSTEGSANIVMDDDLTSDFMLKKFDGVQIVATQELL